MAMFSSLSKMVARVFGSSPAPRSASAPSATTGEPNAPVTTRAASANSRAQGSSASFGRPATVVTTTSASGAQDAQPAPEILDDWTPKEASFWTARAAHVIKRLRSDWEEDPEASKFPDVKEALDLLAAPPEEFLRQLPAAARDAMAFCDNASLSRVQLADRLSQDPSLVQGLLRQANSAFYGAGLQSILRVDAAIGLIGIAGTRAVILASCVDGLLAKPGPPFDATLAATWSHMVNCGPIARALAPAFGADPEEAFAIALLHDVGKLVFFDRVSALRHMKRKPVSLPDAWLSVAIDRLHEPLGALAAHRWGLGAGAADAIGSHHRRARPGSWHPMAETLFLAERAEHASVDQQLLDLEGLWSLGQLGGDRKAVLNVLDGQLRAA